MNTKTIKCITEEPKRPLTHKEISFTTRKKITTYSESLTYKGLNHNLKP